MSSAAAGSYFRRVRVGEQVHVARIGVDLDRGARGADEAPDRSDGTSSMRRRRAARARGAGGVSATRQSQMANNATGALTSPTLDVVGAITNMHPA